MKTDSILALIAHIRELGNLLIEQELKERKIDGVVPAHGVVLNILFQQSGPVPIKTIVEKTGRVKSTVTGMLQTLERYEYIRKYPSQSDSRVIHVELTKKGKSIKKDFESISKKLLEQLYTDMPMQDREHLVDQLLHIEKNLSII